jgi:hypothetical protein
MALHVLVVDDAIVLDSIMPGEPSEKLALHVKALRLPVVMISGSMESMIFADEHGPQLLEKPFRLPCCVVASSLIRC